MEVKWNGVVWLVMWSDHANAEHCGVCVHPCGVCVRVCVDAALFIKSAECAACLGSSNTSSLQ